MSNVPISKESNLTKSRELLIKLHGRKSFKSPHLENLLVAHQLIFQPSALHLKYSGTLQIIRMCV